jgi:hypothetical protein
VMFAPFAKCSSKHMRVRYADMKRSEDNANVPSGNTPACSSLQQNAAATRMRNDMSATKCCGNTMRNEMSATKCGSNFRTRAAATCNASDDGRVAESDESSGRGAASYDPVDHLPRDTELVRNSCDVPVVTLQRFGDTAKRECFNFIRKRRKTTACTYE